MKEPSCEQRYLILARGAEHGGAVIRHKSPERRRIERPPRIAPRVIGRARVAPGYARLELGLDPEEWYPVVDRHP